MKRGRKPSPPIKLEQILIWADEYRQRTGKYPTCRSGRIGESAMTWTAIDGALRQGLRGLPTGMSLPRLLREHRGTKIPPSLTENQILEWVDAFLAKHGRPPTAYDGPVFDSGEETWKRIDCALRRGGRGLRGGESLGILIAKRRGLRTQAAVPPLTIPKILQMADSFFTQTGRWPRAQDGPIPGFPGETWPAINSALRGGYRGLAGGSSLAEILREHRGKRNRRNPPRLTEAAIIHWVKEYEKKTGKRPTPMSGPIDGAPGETWCAVDMALRQGSRGLRPGSTLFRLMQSAM
jgi:hypothetical protein